jgi:hypothetical protein
MSKTMNKCAENFENYLDELIDKNGILDTKKLNKHKILET